MRRIVLLFPVCWVFLACCRQYGHFPRNVDVAEIAGFWRLSDDSVRLLDREVFAAGEGKICNINLLVSGECEFSSYSTAERKIIHEKGVWRVEHNALIGPDERVTNLVTISFAGQRTTERLFIGQANHALVLWTLADNGWGDQFTIAYYR